MSSLANETEYMASMQQASHLTNRLICTPAGNVKPSATGALLPRSPASTCSTFVGY